MTKLLVDTVTETLNVLDNSGISLTKLLVDTVTETLNVLDNSGISLTKLLVDTVTETLNVLDNSGISLTKLLVDTVTETLNWREEDLRERLSGVCVDGQYIHLKLGTHLSNILQIPQNIMDDSVIWDAAHRLELSAKYAKVGKAIDGRIVGETKWFLELDEVLQHIMKNFRYGSNHADLEKIAKEQHQVFLEFNLFSETRFVEYSHRTYSHFVRMYPILVEKLKRDDEKAETEKGEEKVEHLQNLLIQLELVVNLLFMTDLSHLLTFCSKEFQRFNVLPFYAMMQYFKLKENLISAKSSFNLLRLPEPIPLHKTDHNSSYTVWETFGNSLKMITDSQSFQNVKLLTRSDRGRVTRSKAASGLDEEGFQGIIDRKFKLYSIYLDALISYLASYFEPWPEWVILCNNSLNFTNDLDFHEREESFSRLLDMPNGLHPLLDGEKQLLKAEYVALHRNALYVTKRLSGTDPTKLKKFTCEDIWYVSLTEDEFYKNCKFLNNFVLRFLNRSCNECVVESEVSGVAEVQSSTRPLNDLNAEKLNFISSNGPHPLVSMGLVEDTLSNYFGKDWHFTLSQSKWFISKTVDRQFREAKMAPNSLV